MSLQLVVIQEEDVGDQSKGGGIRKATGDSHDCGMPLPGVEKGGDGAAQIPQPWAGESDLNPLLFQVPCGHVFAAQQMGPDTVATQCTDWDVHRFQRAGWEEAVCLVQSRTPTLGPGISFPAGAARPGLALTEPEH